MLEQDTDRIKDVIQKACDEAAKKGLVVKVELHASGFFPGERLDLVVTASPKGVVTA